MLRTRGEDEGKRFENAIMLEVVGIKTSGEAVFQMRQFVRVKNNTATAGKKLCSSSLVVLFIV